MRHSWLPKHCLLLPTENFPWEVCFFSNLRSIFGLKSYRHSVVLKGRIHLSHIYDPYWWGRWIQPRWSNNNRYRYIAKHCYKSTSKITIYFLLGYSCFFLREFSSVWGHFYLWLCLFWHQDQMALRKLWDKYQPIVPKCCWQWRESFLILIGIVIIVWLIIWWSVNLKK